MSIPRDLNAAAKPYADPAAWAAMFARVKAAGADGVAGEHGGLLYLTKGGKFAGTIPMQDADRVLWA